MQDKKFKLNLGAMSDKIGLIIALVAVVIIFSIFNHNFFSYTNMMNILIAASLTGLVAIGESYLIIAGLVDLSAGSVAAFASVLVAVLLSKGFGFLSSILISIIAGVLVGYINALAINKVKLEPFIATLATMSIVRGFAYIICSGNPIYIRNKSVIDFGRNRIMGIPYPVIVLILMFIIFGVILAKTRFGRSIYVIGGNKQAARLSGLNPEKISSVLFMVTGALAALGGIILAARMNSGQPAAANGLEFDAITAAVLGGIAFSGGVGTIFGTVLGVLILQGFNTGLIMMNVPSFWQLVAKGMLLVVALTFDYFRKQSRDKKLLQQSMALLENKK
jgi:ribose transport system permease protein